MTKILIEEATVKQVLEALEKCRYRSLADKIVDPAITALRKLMAEQPAQQKPCGGCYGSGWITRDPDIGTDQECFVCGGSGACPKEPEQEPVAWSPKDHYNDGWKDGFTAALAQRIWVGLTGEEVKHQWEVWRANAPRYAGFAKGIEAKLREKNT